MPSQLAMWCYTSAVQIPVVTNYSLLLLYIQPCPFNLLGQRSAQHAGGCNVRATPIPKTANVKSCHQQLDVHRQ